MLKTVQQDRDCEDVRQARREYGDWPFNVVNMINLRELIFVDESGIKNAGAEQLEDNAPREV